jgi:hypothetical protein
VQEAPTYQPPKPVSQEPQAEEIELPADVVDEKVVKWISKEVSRQVGEAKRSVMTEMTMEDNYTQVQKMREDANRAVYEKHPELLDTDEGVKKVDDVPFAAKMQEVYQEFPELMYAPRGPKVAMEIAERRIGESENVRHARLDAAQKENERRSSVEAATMISSASASGSQGGQEEVHLSKDEELIARKMGLTPQDYSKYKKKSVVNDAEYYAKFKTVKPKQ